MGFGAEILDVGRAAFVPWMGNRWINESFVPRGILNRTLQWPGQSTGLYDPVPAGSVIKYFKTDAIVTERGQPVIFPETSYYIPDEDLTVLDLKQKNRLGLPVRERAVVKHILKDRPKGDMPSLFRIRIKDHAMIEGNLLGEALDEAVYGNDTEGITRHLLRKQTRGVDLFLYKHPSLAAGIGGVIYGGLLAFGISFVTDTFKKETPKKSQIVATTVSGFLSGGISSMFFPIFQRRFGNITAFICTTLIGYGVDTVSQKILFKS